MQWWETRDCECSDAKLTEVNDEYVVCQDDAHRGWYKSTRDDDFIDRMSTDLVSLRKKKSVLIAATLEESKDHRKALAEVGNSSAAGGGGGASDEATERFEKEQAALMGDVAVMRAGLRSLQADVDSLRGAIAKLTTPDVVAKLRMADLRFILTRL